MNLLDLSLKEISEVIQRLNGEKYRASQIAKWLYAGVPFEKMTNIPSKLISDLKSLGFNDGILNIDEVLESKDGTKKYLLVLNDGLKIECVLMKNNYGNTLCISSQVGCAMGCLFCASGKHGKIRDLTAGEMLGQFITVNSLMGHGRNIKNIVVMGMGEPLDNYVNLISFLNKATDSELLGISSRDISVSTCGLPDEIISLSKEKIPVNLCISLHACTDEKRKMIMPIAYRYSIKDVIAAAKKYYSSNHRRIIIEYSLIKGFNDSDNDIRLLKELLTGLNCHINVIALNNNDNKYEIPSKKHTHSFVSKLQKANLSATVRQSYGSDISGACGQLWNKNYKEELN